MEFAEATKHHDALNEECERLSRALNAFPKLENGMTPDAVKFSPEYRAAKAAYDASFRQVRAFNQYYQRVFKTQIAEARRDRRSNLLNGG